VAGNGTVRVVAARSGTFYRKKDESRGDVPDVHDVGRRRQRVAHHLARNLDLAIVAAADPPALRAHARRRGWHRLRLLSAGSGMFPASRHQEAAGTGIRPSAYGP